MDDPAMPLIPPTQQKSAALPSAAPDRSVHFDLVKEAIPSWLLNSSTARISALKAARLTLPDWYKNASSEAHQKLKNELQLAGSAQNDVDRALSHLQDASAFAKPLLQQALKDRYGIEDDVEQTWLRLYAPVKKPWWVHDFSGGLTSRTVSLLDAALHNFSHNEAFTSDSEFITRPDARGHFAVKHLKQKMSIEQFKALCRELNIGARYEERLNEYLLSTNKVASNYLRLKVTLSQKRTLGVAAQMALMKKDIDRDAYHVVQEMIEDRALVTWNGKRISYYNLSIMDTSLTGILVMAANMETATSITPVIVYVPNDPEHPLKQYPSSLAFMAELTRQLRDTQPDIKYQSFFSQFVNQHQRGHFFAGLNDRLSKVQWHPTGNDTNLPHWRETPVDNPKLQFRLSVIQEDRGTRFTGDLWRYVYEQKLNKIFNDAREIAISTEYADRMARWAWWDNLEKMLSDVLNIALLVVGPFVPVLGPLMVSYIIHQLAFEAIEGWLDLAQGRFAEFGEQFVGVLETAAQLAAFAGAGALGSAAWVKLSPFFEGLKPIQLPDGKTRLWNPDLTPYRQPDLQLPSDAKPDAQGIYQYKNQRILRLDDQHFEVKTDSVTGQNRIQHPQRADAYAPTLQHNGEGAWVGETENPREWEGATLMRRIGHLTDAFSDAQLEQMRQVSDTDEAVLRRMHVENTPPPPLLTDTLQRLASPGSVGARFSPRFAVLFSDFPELPESIAEKILDSATESEREQILQNRLPLRLKNQARELQFETQSVRAAQGLLHGTLTNLDTERLALGVLQRHTDMFGNLRIEVRQGTFDGELRCSAGAEDATRVRVLIRDESGHYQVRDGSNQPIHDAEGLLEALLHAMGKEGRQSLGYRPGDAEQFRQWLIAKSAPFSERRTVLATPPIRPVVKHETMVLVRGGALSRNGVTLHERIQDLHPHFSENEVNAFAEALTERGEPLRSIEQDENDLDELQVILNRWEYQQPQNWGPDPKGFLNGGGQHIVERLIDCFERKNTEFGSRTDPASYALDLSREMLPLDLQLWWSRRPELKKFLDRITVLKLDNTRFSAGQNGLLKDFPNLRELSAKGCELTSLPEDIGAMHRLERLRLSDNRIELSAQAVEQLKNLTFMEILRLENNPLRRTPDITRMPRLKVASLSNTGLSTWPEGTFAKPRPRGFLLNLRGNPISEIPDVVPSSPRAWIVARTRLDVGTLSDLNQVFYQELRRSVTLPPEPVVLPNELPVPHIISEISTSRWRDVPGWGVDRTSLWADLYEDPEAHGFLRALVDIQSSADYQAGGVAQLEVQERMWRMLDAVKIDTPLREKLFTMAIAPVNCEDAGAQLFNHMGIQVLASEAYSFTTDPVQTQRQLVTLAKGAARLELVNEIARADMQSRSGNPDEVEVYLAYQTSLAQRLNLPWQSGRMYYRGVSGVSDAMIERAYDTVLELEEGDGLVNKMLEQDFWTDYLQKKWPVRMESNKLKYQRMYEQLESVRDTRREWADSAQLSDEQRSALNDRLKAQAKDLPIPENELFVDQPVSDAVFDRWLNDLGSEEKKLSIRLTKEALNRAGQ
jgi:hypothetical protein